MPPPVRQVSDDWSGCPTLAVVRSSSGAVPDFLDLAEGRQERLMGLLQSFVDAATGGTATPEAPSTSGKGSAVIVLRGKRGPHLRPPKRRQR